MTAQNLSIRPNLVKAKNSKSQCTVCRKVDESIDHIVNSCKLAEKEYKGRHDNLGKIVHWKLTS